MIYLERADKTNITDHNGIGPISRTGNLFFWLGIFCELVVSFSGHLFGGYYENYIIVLGMACFAVKIILSMDFKKDLPLFIILAVYGLICYKVQHAALILRIILILLAGRDQDNRKVIKLFFWGTLSTMVVTCIISALGLYNTMYVTGLFRHTYDEVRYTFGFFNPNGFTLFWFRVFVLGIYAYYDKLKIWMIMAAFAVYLPFVYLSDSKTGMGIGLIATIAFIVAKLVKKEFTLKIIYIIGNLFMAFCIVFSYISMIFFYADFNENGKPIGFWQPVNQYVMTGRFSNAQATYLQYPITLFGMAKGTETTEMDFVSSLYNYGAVFIAFYAILLFVLFYKLYKEKNKAGMVLVLMTTMYSMSESFLVYVNKNAVLMLGIGMLLDFAICFGKKRDTVPESKDGKKTIKIDFVDFWPDLNKTDNYFYNKLSKFYNVVISDTPDYVFCSNFGRRHSKYRDCIKIYYSGENIVPDFNSYDYALGFQDIVYGDRYKRLPLYALYTDVIEKAKNKHTFDDKKYLDKSGFCNYVISNPAGAKERMEIIDAIDEYQTLESGGRYRNNVGGPVKDKMAFASQYKFSLAIENSSHAGYTTEKIFEAFGACTLPIYWGDPDIAKDFNPKSFINAMDFANFEELRDYVEKVDTDDELYLSYMKADILGEGARANEYLADDYADDFLKNIFDMDIEKAYRRNMVYFGKQYEVALKDANKVLGVFELVSKPMHYIEKKLSQISSSK